MMEQHTLDKLQFEHVRDSLAACCACSLGKNLARKIEPARKPDVIRRWFGQVRQMEAAWQRFGPPPLGGVRDIGPLLHAAGTPAGIDAHELLRVAETLYASSALCRWVAALTEDHAMISAVGQRIGDFGAVAARIDRAIDAHGIVRDEASPRLTTIRRAIDQARTDIDQTFERILRDVRVLRMLQYPNATFHDDRRVLPLKENYRGQVKGIIHRSSDSGATLFVEPADAVQLNNAVVSLKEEESREVIRILAALSFLIHQNEAAIRATLEAIGVLDLIAAKVRYLQARDAVCPEISDDRVLVLNEARHPVLLDLARDLADDARRVVPINARLGDDFDLLVITGPNTGGKTVTLKTVGLLTLMTQCGIPIPAGPGSRVPVYRNIFIDVGDEQSIEQSLSTFSSHLSNILQVLHQAGDSSLVLLDELGAGTDPDEGAAIGRAVIDELLRLRCSGVITTHLSALKAVAYTSERVDNGSVEFDVETLRPTYHLRIGEPGESNALAIAQRLGMPRRLIESARRHLRGRDRALRRAIAGTLDSRRQAERARLDAHRALLDAEQERIHFQTKQRLLEQERQAHQDWSAWISVLRPGDEVFLPKFDCYGRVVRMQLHRQNAVVNTGAVDMEVHLREIAKPPVENG